MKPVETVVFAAFLTLISAVPAVAQTPPVQNGISTSTYRTTEIQARWGVKIYSNRMLDISPREFGRCTADPVRPLVYCGASDGIFRALRKDNGEQVWSMTTSGGVRAAPAISDMGLYLATTDGFMYRVDPETGRQLWDAPFQTDNPVWGSPVVIGDLVYFSVPGNQVYAIGAQDGRFKFKVSRDKPTDMTTEGVSEPTVAGDVLYSAFSDGVLTASNRFTGEPLWQQDISAGTTGSTDADSTPVVIGDVVFSGAFSAGPIAVRATDGAILWKGSRLGVSKPVAFRNNIIVADADGYVVALDRETGREVWVTKLDTKAAWAPVLVGEYLLVGGDRGIWVLRADNGAPLLLKTFSFGVTAEPAVQGNDIYFVAPGGTINAATLLAPR